MHPNQFLPCHFREVGGLINYVAALIDSLQGYLLSAWLISCHIECGRLAKFAEFNDTRPSTSRCSCVDDYNNDYCVVEAAARLEVMKY
eukprot:scaffold272_cov143-Skeletonema_marinoi.AAC.5